MVAPSSSCHHGQAGVIADDGAFTRPAFHAHQRGQMVTRLPRLPTMALYALAHAGKTLFWVVSDLYFIWMVTVVGGVSGARAGLGIGLSILLAAGADYLGGRWLGRRITGAAKNARVQFHACLATALALLLFAGAGLYHGAHLAGAMMVALILFRRTYAGLDITQNALPALIAQTPEQQASYAMWRNIAGGAIRILLNASFVPLLASHTPGQQAWRFLALAGAIGMAACLTAWALNRRLSHDPTDRRPPTALSTAEAGSAPLRMLAAMALASAGMTLFQQLEPFLAARMSAGTGPLFLTCSGAGGLICQPFWRALLLGHGARRFHAGVVVACLIDASLMLAPQLLDAGSIPWAIMAGLLYGAGAGGMLLALWTRINASLPRNALARISRLSAGAKLGQALGLVLAGWQIQSQTTALTTMMALALLPMVVAMAVAASPNRRRV